MKPTVANAMNSNSGPRLTLVLIAIGQLLSTASSMSALAEEPPLPPGLTVYVNKYEPCAPTGTSPNCVYVMGGAVSGPLLNITEAILIAGERGTVVVATGLYPEVVNIFDTPLTLKALNGPVIIMRALPPPP
jgi:hypothetical protein